MIDAERAEIGIRRHPKWIGDALRYRAVSARVEHRAFETQPDRHLHGVRFGGRRREARAGVLRVPDLSERRARRVRHDVFRKTGQVGVSRVRFVPVLGVPWPSEKASQPCVGSCARYAGSFPTDCRSPRLREVETTIPRMVVKLILSWPSTLKPCGKNPSACGRDGELIAVRVGLDRHAFELADGPGAYDSEYVFIGRFIAHRRDQAVGPEGALRVAERVAPDFGERVSPNAVGEDRGRGHRVAEEPADDAGAVVFDRHALRLLRMTAEEIRHRRARSIR